ncbi:hypothetical protein [Actinoplanes sp. TFC3]|uniref:hypothetical protein n=1 Tax=Actinoplanes sp. TFC3 TaxID=1710355 RepID=UPI00083637CC|nr:hypothetical protein [Actinoplanes sp. TFC3]
MSHTGEELGADLVDLYDAGRYKMKVVAEQFREAGGELFRTEGLTGVFARNPALGGVYGSAKAPWEGLRDAIVDVIFETAANMDDTGLALMMAAEEYAATDDVAAKKYEAMKVSMDQFQGMPS